MSNNNENHIETLLKNDDVITYREMQVYNNKNVKNDDVDTSSINTYSSENSGRIIVWYNAFRYYLSPIQNYKRCKNLCFNALNSVRNTVRNTLYLNNIDNNHSRNIDANYNQ